MKRILILIAMLAAGSGCGGGDDDDDGGPAFDASGNYTITYERISRSDTCDTRDMDFIAGILTVTHNQGSITLDFGSGAIASGSVNVDGIYDVAGTFEINSETVTFTSVGVVTETDISSDVDVDPSYETIGDYDFDADPEPDCRIRGKLSGAKSG